MRFALTSDLHYGIDGKTQAKHQKFWRKLAAVEGVDLLIIAGDLGTNRQSHVRGCLRTMREHISWPAAMVMGNHDFWSDKEHKSHMNFNEILSAHKELSVEFKVTYLEQQEVVIGDHIIIGFDSWYRSYNPPTNDRNWMPFSHEGVPVHVWMAHRANKSLDRILQIDTELYNKVICVTHFPPYTPDTNYEEYCAPARYLEFLTEKADVLCLGHSHKLDTKIIDDCQILNSGSDYNRPRAIIFNTETMSIEKMIM